jgi:hypothetical protein
MSRGQSTQAFNTASNENAADFGNAQSAFGSTEDAIGNYNNQLAKFVSGNPYTQGGEYDQTINTGLSNVSDAGANSLAGALQAQARRTGQNSAADAATAAAGAQQNTRDLSGDLAAAQQKRIAGEAGYNQAALGASAVPINANQSLYGRGAEPGAASTRPRTGNWAGRVDSTDRQPGQAAIASHAVTPGARGILRRGTAG